MKTTPREPLTLPVQDSLKSQDSWLQGQLRYKQSRVNASTPNSKSEVSVLERNQKVSQVPNVELIQVDTGEAHQAPNMGGLKDTNQNDCGIRSPKILQERLNVGNDL